MSFHILKTSIPNTADLISHGDFFFFFFTPPFRFVSSRHPVILGNSLIALIIKAQFEVALLSGLMTPREREDEYEWAKSLSPAYQASHSHSDADAPFSSDAYLYF